MNSWRRIFVFQYMSYIKHILLVLCTLAGLSASAAGAVTASTLMQKMYLRMHTAKAVDVKFTIDGEGGAVQGTATLAADKFAFDTPQMAVWYDGRTQWAYLKSSSEVSITEPSPAEVIATNPFAILSNYTDAYRARLIADEGGCKRVELTPVDRHSGISAIIITVAPSGDWPKAVTVRFDDTRSIVLKVDAIKAVAAVPKSTFTYNPKLFPANEIIDLR